MKILHIIGNGIDIAHHMKTSYQDFFKYYLSLKTTDLDIAAMKVDIEKQKNETWADLEIGLGKYSKKCATKEIFLKCVADIKEQLTDYLKTESDKIKLFGATSLDRFYQFAPLFEPEPRSRYLGYVNKLGSMSREVDIITLNYTSTLEALTGYDSHPIDLTDEATLGTIQHIHGTLLNMMAMGVNDQSQIANEAFRGDLDVEEEFIKPEFNDACMNNKNAICRRLINEANIIVIYGTSVGPSDDKWWKLIGKRMDSLNYPLLIYLPYDEKKNLSAEPNHLRRWTRGYVAEIKRKFDITQSEDILFNRVCIAINQKLIPLKRVALVTK